MATDGKQWNQILVSDAEMNLLHTIRDIDPEENPSEEHTGKLQQISVSLLATIADRSVGHYTVEGSDLIVDCAKVGAEIQSKILSQEWADGMNVQADSDWDKENEEDLIDETIVQVMNEEMFEEPIPWGEVRSEVIPPYIQNVTFTISKNDLTNDRRKELAERFPDVVIQEAVALPSLSGSNRSAKRQTALEQPLEKPNGIKTAVFELDEDLTTKDSTLEAGIRKQYPWARIKTSVDVLTDPNLLREKAQLVGDVEAHLQDFASFMTEYPPCGEFDVASNHTPTWSALGLPQKLCIAHARAIQRPRYGETQNATERCAKCKQKGYVCRVYRKTFVEKAASTSHINLGHGCQHCRLLGEKCDLLPYHLDSNLASAEHNFEFTGSSGSARAYSMDSSSEATVTTPQPASRTPGLANRTTRAPVPQSCNNILLNCRDVQCLGAQLGLDLTHPSVIWSIYKEWENTGKVGAFQNHMDIQHYYTTLVNLMVMARARDIPKLEFATLLRFQSTVFEQEDLPDFDNAVTKAFEHFPVQSPLCRWIALVFSYEWDTVKDGDYDKFLEENGKLDPVTLNKLLYGVALGRDPYTVGRSLAVFKEWCTVHDHDSDPEKGRRCMEEKRIIERLISSRSSRILPNTTSENSQNRTSKRSFDDSGGFRRNKNVKRNNNHRYGSRSDLEDSTEKDASNSVKDNDSDDATLASTDAGAEINIGRHSLRSTRGKKQSTKPVESTPNTNNTPRRRGRPPKHAKNKDDETSKAHPTQKPGTSGLKSALLSDDQLDSRQVSDSDPSGLLPDQRSKSIPTKHTPERAPETPQRSPAPTENLTSERRSARAKPLPPGFFRQHLPRKKFENTMWGGFGGA